MQGLTAPKIENKLALRASTTGSIYMSDVPVPRDHLLEGVSGLKGPFSCLNNARFGISYVSELLLQRKCTLAKSHPSVQVWCSRSS